MLLKKVAKNIPGAVRAVRVVRIARRNLVKRLFRASLFSASTAGRRAILFEVLPGNYALAEHVRESYLVRTGDRYIGRGLFARGDFDFDKFETAFRLLEEAGIVDRQKPLPTLIDAGANVGSICIPAVKRGFAGRCVAIEPDPENIRLLKINSLLNKVEDLIDIRRAALGASQGFASIIRSDTNFGDHRVRVHEGGDSECVPMITLDDLTEHLDPKNTILWMDIQGFEGFALAGAKRLCRSGVPLIFEFSKPDLEAAGSFDHLIQAIEDSNYTRFFDLSQPTLQEHPVSAAALIQLGDELAAQGAFTDLLLLTD